MTNSVCRGKPRLSGRPVSLHAGDRTLAWLTQAAGSHLRGKQLRRINTRRVFRPSQHLPARYRQTLKALAPAPAQRLVPTPRREHEVIVACDSGARKNGVEIFLGGTARTTRQWPAPDTNTVSLSAASHLPTLIPVLVTGIQPAGVRQPERILMDHKMSAFSMSWRVSRDSIHGQESFHAMDMAWLDSCDKHRNEVGTSATNSGIIVRYGCRPEQAGAKVILPAIDARRTDGKHFHQATPAGQFVRINPARPCRSDSGPPWEGAGFVTGRYRSCLLDVHFFRSVWPQRLPLAANLL